MNAQITFTVYHKGCEAEVDVAAYVTEGGSNSHGSDEPAWMEIEDRAYTHPITGKPVSPRLVAHIEKENGAYIDERLCEAYSSW